MSALLSQTALTARYKPGQSPLGHHWELFDADENAVGRTKREYSGGLVKRQLWRTVTATGMDNGNDIRARILDTEGTEILQLHSVNVDSKKGIRPHVVLMEPAGTVVGTAHHDEGDVVRIADAAERVVATLPVADKEQGAWTLLDPAGEPIGVVTREPAKRVAGPSLLDYALGINLITDNAADFAATMFRGFLWSNIYSVSMPELPPSGPARTLLVLTPVLLGHLY